MTKEALEYCNKVCPKRWQDCMLCLKDGKDGRRNCEIIKAFQAGYKAAQKEDEEFKNLIKEGRK